MQDFEAQSRTEGGQRIGYTSNTPHTRRQRHNNTFYIFRIWIQTRQIAPTMDQVTHIQGVIDFLLLRWGSASYYVNGTWQTCVNANISNSNTTGPIQHCLFP